MIIRQINTLGFRVVIAYLYYAVLSSYVISHVRREINITAAHQAIHVALPFLFWLSD